MFRALLKIICVLLIVEMLGFILTGVWIVHDGLRDNFDHADVALVPGYAEIKDTALASTLTDRLDRAAALYTQGKFPVIVVSGETPANEDDESDAMAKYLEAHDVPASAIMEDHRAESSNDIPDGIVQIMEDKKFHSVLLIADYDRLPRMKLVLQHEGVRETEQAHVGEWKLEDGKDVVREDVAIYGNLYHWYLLPAIAQAQEVAKSEAHQVKETVDKKLDSAQK